MGKKFGMLTVIDYEGVKNKNSYYDDEYDFDYL